MKLEHIQRLHSSFLVIPGRARMKTKRVKKWIFIISLLILAGIGIGYRKTLTYGFRQAKGQISIIWHTRPVENVLNDPAIPDSIKTAIREIGIIKSFAAHTLGLKSNRNYTTYYDQQPGYKMWVLTACQPFRLEAYEWKFPVLGSFSYKGYFDRKVAEKEERKLQSEGYDTEIREAQGWSTLGLLRDPILSGMLDRDEAGLADLIIHELTHGTIFFKDSVDYNENLATFIGTYGTLEYLKKRFGENSKEVSDYTSLLSDRYKFNHYMLRACHMLDSLYSTFSSVDNLELKKQLKEKMIRTIVRNLDTIRFTSRYKNLRFFSSGIPNNTYFSSFLQYRGKQPYFIDELNNRFTGNLIRYIEFLKKKDHK